MPSIAERAAALSPDRLALLQRRLAVKQTQSATPQRITRRSGNGPAPLSFGQERMWFIDQLQSGSPAYNVPAILPLPEPLDVPLLKRCLTEIVRRHEVLRTTFHHNGNEVVQKVDAAPDVAFEILSVEDAPDQAGALTRLCGDEFRRPFDLARGPLLRAVLIRLGAVEPPQNRLLLTMHHIVSDAWSMQLLLAELRALYAAYAAGLASPLPDLAIQYADFAEWQREWLRGQARDQLLSYWKRHLAGAPALLNLPTDRPRPALSSMRGAMQTLKLPAPTVAKLKAIGNAQHCTLFMTMLAVFAVLLHRYTDEHDLVIGTPIANRGRSELEPLIGFFLNTLALRVDASGDPSFTEFLKRVREVTLGGFAHQDLPFEVLVKELQPSRNLSANPLFQVMFVLQNQQPGSASELATPGDDDGDEPTEREHDTTFGISRFDLTLGWTEAADALEGMFEYSTDLFDPATIKRMAEHLRVLAEAAAEGPDLRLSQLPLLTEGERGRSGAWNATAAPYPEQLCIHHLFENRAREAPEATALVFGNVVVSYGELDRRANQLAHYLQDLGVGPESIVGLFVERSVEMIVGLLAILKAGAAYLPLDPDHPAERLAFMMRDAGIDVVLSRQPLISQLPPAVPRCVAIDGDWPQIGRCSEDPPTSAVGPDNAAYVIYTSGSTGWPKGVIVPHRGAVNVAQAAVETFAIKPRDRILQFASLNFDASIFELLMWLWGGATLCLASREDLLPGPPLLRTIRANDVTVLGIPPSALAMVPIEPLETLRLIIVMGEACPAELAMRWRAVVGRVFNAYGPTETSMWVTGTDLDGSSPVTIGRPIANSRIHILDRHLNPVPVGVVAEIYVAGVGMGRGYLRRPALTAERFVPSPFAEGQGERLYRTGDLARYLPGGEIELVGRCDHQVKIRGYRIELGEVESVLCRHPAVRHAAVVAIDTPQDGKTLVAYVVAPEIPEPAATELRRFVRQTLPDYAVPSAFVLLDALPLTPSGKIARDALPRPKLQNAEADSQTAPQDSRVQQTMARIWADVLRVAQVGVDDNFFDVGGHSLMAVQIISRVRDTFDVELSLHNMFDAPTVRLLSAVVEANLKTGLTAATGAREGAHPMAPAPERSPALAIARHAAAPASTYPLSYAQERMWFIERVQPGQSTYNIPHRLALAEPLDVAAAERALAEMVCRHETLRTTFASDRDSAVQVVAPAGPVTLPVVDLRSVPPDYRWRVAADIATTETDRPFDLIRGPLFRAMVVRWHDQWSELLLTIHHIVTDGWSLSVFSQELTALYEAFRTGRPSALREPALQYRDYVTWQRDHLQGATLDRLLSFWRSQLGGVAALRLPIDHPRPSVPTNVGAQRQFAIAPDVMARLRQISQQCGTTMFVVTLAAFKLLLSRYSRQTDIVVGTAVANRNRSEHEAILGLFVNSLVLRTDLSGAPSFLAMVDRVREVTLQALEHQDLPFERIVAELTPERVLGANPIFQVFFAHNGLANDAANAGAAEPSTEHFPGTAKFDLNLQLFETAGRTLGLVEYSVALFDASTIDGMIEDFCLLLDAVAAAPDQAISALPPLASSIKATRSPQGSEHDQAPPAEPARTASRRNVVAPADPMEHAVAEIWSDVLGLKEISVADDFFELGGHSLQVIRVLSRLRDVLGVELQVAQFFSAPTVAGIAALIMQQREPDGPAAQAAQSVSDGEVALGAAIVSLGEDAGATAQTRLSP